MNYMNHQEGTPVFVVVFFLLVSVFNHFIHLTINSL